MGEGNLVWAEINLSHLRHNLRILRSMAKKSKAGILAVVKADAYGHGMEEVAGALYQNGVGFFGVASIDEALRLRRYLRGKKRGSQADILVLGSFHANQVGDYVRENIRPTVSSLEDVQVLEKWAGKKSLAVHVKIDTGMARLGVWHEQALALFERIQKSGLLEIEGVYTHFSSADDRDAFFTKLQMHRFETVLEKLRERGIRPRYVHAANSLGLARFEHTHLNLVRPGILLYGLNPSRVWKPSVQLKPVMSLKAKISFLKSVEAGRPLSYDRTYQTSAGTRIATLPVGYSHGYRVGFSNKSSVIVRGKRCPVVGRVTMDHTLVDVGKVPGVRRWDEVTLLGAEGKSRISAEELAEWLGTIPYEVVCAIHSRVPRIYKA